MHQRILIQEKKYQMKTGSDSCETQKRKNQKDLFEWQKPICKSKHDAIADRLHCHPLPLCSEIEHDNPILEHASTTCFTLHFLFCVGRPMQTYLLRLMLAASQAKARMVCHSHFAVQTRQSTKYLHLLNCQVGQQESPRELAKDYPLLYPWVYWYTPYFRNDLCLVPSLLLTGEQTLRLAATPPHSPWRKAPRLEEPRASCPVSPLTSAERRIWENHQRKFS